MNNIWIIIVNFNGTKDTIECIESIYKNTMAMVSVLVVDNASNEVQKRDLIKYCNQKKCKYLLLDENVGFGIANNIGADEAISEGADYILMLNNDTIVAPDFVENIIRNVEENKIYVPLIYKYNQKKDLWYGGGHIDFIKGKSVMYEFETDKPEVTFASGCCMLINKNIIQKYGLFSNEYFMYYEDTDFCLKMMENNIKFLINKKAKIWHKVGNSSDKISGLKDYYLTRNRLILIEKYHKRFCVVTCWIYFMITRLIMLVYYFIHRYSAYYLLRGVYDYKKGIKGTVDLKK